jgi:hypothetical protein
LWLNLSLSKLFSRKHLSSLRLVRYAVVDNPL